MSGTSTEIEIEEKKVESSGPDASRTRMGVIIGVASFIGIVAIVIITTVLTLKDEPAESLPVIKNTEKLDCLPQLKLFNYPNEEAMCKERSCIYDAKNAVSGAPRCYYNIDKLKYKLKNTVDTSLGKKYTIENIESKYSIVLEFEFLHQAVLRFKLSKENEKAYEVPITIRSAENKAENVDYDIEVSSDKDDFYFKIIRKSSKQVIWDTSLRGLMFDKNFIQIATHLPSKYVYGFGENSHESFKHDISYRSWPMFSRDQAPSWTKEANLYGVQPFYTCMEEDGNSHGVLLVNSNAMEYEFIPAPGLIYRTTGGVLDFYAFLGPDPETVIQQYTHFIGRTFFPPYWALGFQISRYGYLDLEDMKQVLVRMKKYNIPIDTQVADIDHMDERKIFTIDQEKWGGIDQYFKELNAQGMKTIILFDPFLVVNYTDYEPFKRGKEKGVFITWPNGVVNPDFNDTNSNIMLGYCWPKGKVAYPDFFKNVTREWWKDEILKHREKLIYNGLWIDMNEPAVFGTNEERPFNWPEDAKPYWSLKCPDDEYELVNTKASFLYRETKNEKSKLSQKTLCMNAIQGEKNEYKHFDVHSLYGFMQTKPTYEVSQLLDDKSKARRGLVITRSNYIGTGQYAGHWTGDNDSKWSHLYYSIIGMLEFNLFGIPYVGADICGFWFDAPAELCQRWQQVGAFYPFSRNHNGKDNLPQDPGWYGDAVAISSKKALDIRYTLLPYYYTLFYKAHTKGNTVIRPLFHEYPKDKETYTIDKQFLVGSSILISPVLLNNTTKVDAYFPNDHWYSYYDGKILQEFSEKKTGGSWQNLNAPLDFIPIHISGGHVIPTQEPANNTVFSRQKPFGLIIAMDWDGEARGDLFYDDGESFDFLNGKYFYATFIVESNSLKMNIEKNGYSGMNTLKLDTIRIFVPNKPKVTFILNGNTPLNSNQVDLKDNEITLINLNLPMDQEFELSWKSVFVTETRIDCSIEKKDVNATTCNNTCVFDAQAMDRVPKCYVPKTVGGYKIASGYSNQYGLVRADNFSLYGNEVFDLSIDISYGFTQNSVNKFDLVRVKIYDGAQTRYEVPIELNMQTVPNNRMIANVKANTNNKAYFEVKLNNNDLLINNMNLEHGFIFSDQFIQLVTNLGYKNVYGFGENTHYSFKHKFEYSNFWAVFARDQPPGGKQTNLYGTHPFLMAVNDENGRAMGVFILNSNAMEYGFLPPQVFSYRTLGGILDIYILEEESPEKLIQAYTSLIGKPYMPPYWSLGFQLCRYGYDNLKNLQNAVERTRKAGIPLDVQYADIDHFDTQMDFTYNKVDFKGLPDYIKELNSSGIRFIIILDPAINSEVESYGTYKRGTEKDVWVKWPSKDNPQYAETKDTLYMLGYVWPEGKAVFPDFFLDKTKEWWKNEILMHFKDAISFDGLWIDMNEPANFDTNEEKPWNYPDDKPAWNLHCPNDNLLDNPPYLPLAATTYGDKKKISDKTLCMNGKFGDKYNHYDVHNLYGWSQSQPTLDALRAATNLRGIVISRSTYASSGKHAGHWLGDNTSTWKHLKLNIIGLLEFNLFGIPYIGADICGFFDNTTSEMCQRWMQIGAFNTFYRNHNGKGYIEQDPAVFGPNVAHSSKVVTEIRYSLLPYLYTLFYNVNTNGGTVIRSLIQEFPRDKRAADNDEQFLWGSSLLISPVLTPNTRVVYAYFPKARWFDYYTGSEVAETGRMYEIDAPSNYLPLHIRGDSILVTQEPAQNTRASRLNSFGLIIAPSDQNTASGQLYWDGGEEIDPQNTHSLINFNFQPVTGAYEIKNTIVKSNYNFKDTNTLNNARIFGISKKPTKILVNANQNNDWKYDSQTKELKLNNLKLQIDKSFTIRIE